MLTVNDLLVPQMKARSRRVLKNRGSVVERAIQMFDGNASEFQRRLEQVSGIKLSRPQVFYWRTRGQFPPEMVIYVHALTRIPYENLLNRGRPRGAFKKR